MIQIDGSAGEGGGQIVRTSVSLAAVTGRAVEIVNMRARRDRPGLQPQHLAAVRATAEICDAAVDGGHVGSRYVLFEPRASPRAGDYVFDIISTSKSGPWTARRYETERDVGVTR